MAAGTLILQLGVAQNGPTWTDIAQVGLVALQLVVLVAAALIAWNQVKEARRLREEQTRPFVVIDVEPESIFLQISVTNIGTTLATDVHFEFEPPLEVTLEIPDVPPPKDLKMFAEGIPTLPPGKVLRTLLDNFPDRVKRGLPDTYKVTATYSDETRRRSFKETIDLDIGIYRAAGPITRNGVHHVNETLRKMLKEMEHWRSRSHRGLLTMSPAERRAENARIEREREERSEGR